MLSGKGGTGKTSIIGAYAAMTADAVIADCDVDAPNLHVILSPRTYEKGTFIGGKTASIDPGRCSNCAKCVPLCRFGAIKLVGRFGISKVAVDQQTCEGCGLCARVCPSRAVTMVDHAIGEWYLSSTRYGKMAHASLQPGQGNTGRLVACVKAKARMVARDEGARLLLIDGPPGIGCPAISAVSGADATVLVTEPSRSGLSDLQRAAELVGRFRSKVSFIVNKFDLNNDITEEIERWAEGRGLTPLGRIPYDDTIIAAMAGRNTVVEAPASNAGYAITKTYKRLMELLRQS